MTALRAAPSRGFEARFWQALWAPDPAAAAAIAPWSAQPGFAIYRNTVRKACVEALRANFPTVAELVGHTWFQAAALAHVQARPPQDNRLLFYGEHFADFLAGFPPAAELPYLSGVAALDRAWIECLGAADAPVLDAGTLATHQPETLLAARLQVHPACRWAGWTDLPVAEIWSAHRERRFDAQALAWEGGALLLSRPAQRVQWQALSLPGIRFLQACAAGRTLADAAAAALDLDPRLDLAALLAQLLSAGAFTTAPTTTAPTTTVQDRP